MFSSSPSAAGDEAVSSKESVAERVRRQRTAKKIKAARTTTPVAKNSSDKWRAATSVRDQIGSVLQGSAKRWSPGCVNAAGKARQK